ncbi:MAG TPA: hypothetical protein VHC69_28535 [Polyangiaceae bacterium]|nr:hypothetical protein [Polyangiaceae bacterium]
MKKHAFARVSPPRVAVSFLALAALSCSADGGNGPGASVGGAAPILPPGAAATGTGGSAGAPTGAATTPTTTATSPAPTATTPPGPTATTPVPTATVAPPAPTTTATAPAPTGTVAPPAPTTPPTGTTAAPTPPPGTTEFTLTTTPFTLNPGEESFKCQDMPNTIGKDIAIVQASATMAKGSHHMFVFYDTSFNQTVPLTDCTGTEAHDFLILTQSPEETQTYPAGVGRLLKSTQGFRFGMHYLNTTSDPLQANVTARFDYEDTSAVQHLAAQMELNNALLNVPPGQTTQSRNYTVPYGISLLYAISHMHARATHFKATAGAQTLYETKIWDEPVPTTYSPPLLVPGNSTITWECDYQNDTSMTFTFGESAQTNEMCIFFGVFYATDPGSPQGQELDQLI